jgi:hypothetical protein
MRVVHLVRPIVAASITAASACTIWAAIDDPYKSEQAATVDAGSEAAANHQVDAGGLPYAIAAYGDTIYVVDDRATVHIAVAAGTSFTTFFDNADGSDVLDPANRIAASSAGVFWTIKQGIRYCALDGGGCGRLPRGGTPTLIAAGDQVVAWRETGDAGIGRCDVPLSGCTPGTVSTEAPNSIAIEADNTIAFASERGAIGRVGGLGPKKVIPVPYRADFVATDPGSGDLFWIGPDAVGLVPAGSDTAGATTPLNLGGTPSQLFALDGVAYFSVPNTPSSGVDYCKFVGDAGCSPTTLASVPTFRPDKGIAVTSRDVLTIFVGNIGGTPQLFSWPVPR